MSGGFSRDPHIGIITGPAVCLVVLLARRKAIAQWPKGKLQRRIRAAIGKTKGHVSSVLSDAAVAIRAIDLQSEWLVNVCAGSAHGSSAGSRVSAGWRSTLVAGNNAAKNDKATGAMNQERGLPHAIPWPADQRHGYFPAHRTSQCSWRSAPPDRPPICHTPLYLSRRRARAGILTALPDKTSAR